MKTKKFALTVLTFIFIGLFNVYGISPFFNGNQLPYGQNETLTVNDIVISYVDYKKYEYYKVQFSEPVTFDSLNFDDYDDSGNLPSILVYATDGKTINNKKIDVTKSNIDFPKHIVGISIIQNCHLDIYYFEGIQPSPIQNDTVEVVEHDTVYQTVHDTVVQYDTINTTDTVTYFVDTCDTTTEIKSYNITNYDAYVSVSNDLNIDGGTVNNIKIYNTSGQKVKVKKYQNYVYVGDLNSNITYIALIEFENGDKITKKFVL